MNKKSNKNSVVRGGALTPVQRGDLQRVRLIAGLSALVGSLKLLPLVDAGVLAVEWVFLKNGLPMGMSIWDAVKSRTFSWRAFRTIIATENWFSLTSRAFGGLGGAMVLLADMGTDAESFVLPAPLDGFDIPPMAADAAIALLAHRALKKGATLPDVDGVEVVDVSAT